MKVVLLHSALGDSRLWRHQVPVLAERYEVIAPDLPGWGETPIPAEPFSYVHCVAPHLPAVLVGNSFGGLVALQTALSHEEETPGLVLIGAGLRQWDWSEELRDYWAAENAAFEAGDLDGTAQVNLDFWVAPEHQDEVRPQQRRAIELQTVEQEVLWPDVPPLESLDVPTLVVVGDRDKGDFRAIAHHLAERIPGARLAVVEGAGHLVGIDCPAELNALLLEFLEDVVS